MSAQDRITAASGDDEASATSIVWLEVATLTDGPTARTQPVCSDHVAALAEVFDELPPVTVRAATREVIDGAHRVAAARRRGRETVACVLVDVDELGAFAAHVRANAQHGLPLSRAEKRAAALSLLQADSTRSDRDVARICGLSPTTVATVRRSGVQVGHLDGDQTVRRGHDGKRYPAGSGRERDRHGVDSREAGGPADGRAIAWLTHLRRLATTVLRLLARLGPLFGPRRR